MQVDGEPFVFAHIYSNKFINDSVLLAHIYRYIVAVRNVYSSLLQNNVHDMKSALTLHSQAYEWTFSSLRMDLLNPQK